MAKCKFCNKEITWMKDGRRNRAIDSDGGIHSCDEMKKSMNSMKTINMTEIDPEILKQYEKSINEKVKK
jgi:hypothetical protein